MLVIGSAQQESVGRRDATEGGGAKLNGLQNGGEGGNWVDIVVKDEVLYGLVVPVVC